MKVAVVIQLTLFCGLSGVLGGQGSKKCTNPQGSGGESYTEGCLKNTCKSGVWRTSLDSSLCCFEHQTYPTNTTILAKTSDDNCVKAIIDCRENGGEAILDLKMENFCEGHSTAEQVDEIKVILVNHIEQSDCQSIALKETNAKLSQPTITTTASTNTITSPQKDLLYLGISLTVELPSFSSVTNCAVPPYPVSGLTKAVTAIVDGEVMVCGGEKRFNYLSSCHSLVGGVWTTLPGMQEERSRAAASMTDEGLFVTGGWDGRDSHSSTVYFSSGGWVSGPEMPVGLHAHCQVSVGNLVIVIGGYHYDIKASVYKLESGVWTKLPDMEHARYEHFCFQMGGVIFAIGGGGAAKSVEILDISSETWREGPTLPDYLDRGQAVVHHSVLYVLYMDGKVVKLTAEGEWETVANMDHRGPWTFSPATVVTAGELGC